MACKPALPSPLQTALALCAKPGQAQGSLEMARPGLEPGTPRFSGTERQAGKSVESPANRGVTGRARCTSMPVVAVGCRRVKDVTAQPRPFHGGAAVPQGPGRGASAPRVRPASLTRPCLRTPQALTSTSL